jgi:hypothetical protein
MKISKFVIGSSFAAALLIAGVTNDSYAQFGKLKEKLANAANGTTEKKEGGKPADPYKEDFEDASGTSGAYSCLVGAEVPQGIGKKWQKTYKIKFTEKEGGNFVNKMEIFVNKDGLSMKFNLNDKMTKKMGGRVFRTDDFHSIWLVEVEKGMFLEMHHSSTHREELDGSEKAEDVYAKDAAKLEGWDRDVAKAKFDAMFKGGAKKDAAKLKERLMEYKAYKENVGKVVFVPHFNVFNYQYTDKPTEDPTKFIKSQSMGKPLYWGAYLEMPLTTSCGEDCERNVVYEMNGIKADRVALRNSEAKWNKMIKKKEAENKFCINNGVQLWSPSENILDYAFAKVLYENKANFKKGQTYKLTASLYGNRDGNNTEKVAEGSINLIWDDEAMKVMEEKLFKMFREFLDE